MDEHVLSADDGVPQQPRPATVVVILKHAHRETLVKRAEFFVHVTAHSQTEHGQHGNVEAQPGGGPRPIGGELFEATKCPVGHLDLCLVAG